MLKKTGIVLLGVTAALFVLSCTKFGGYLRTACKELRDEANKHVSIEFKIKNLKDQVANLKPDIDRNRSLVAEEIVSVEKLRADVEAARKKLAAQKEQIGKVARQLKDNAATVSYDGKEMTAERAREKLDRDVDNGQRFEAALKSRERQLEARERMLATSMKKLQAMADAKTELEAQIAQIEADYQEVQLQGTQSRVQFDDTRLADAKKTLDDVRDSIRVLQVKQKLDGGETITPDEKKTDKEVITRAEEFAKPTTETKVSADQK